jgi:hypothetical protein
MPVAGDGLWKLPQHLDLRDYGPEVGRECDSTLNETGSGMDVHPFSFWAVETMMDITKDELLAISWNVTSNVMLEPLGIVLSYCIVKRRERKEPSTPPLISLNYHELAAF